MSGVKKTTDNDSFWENKHFGKIKIAAVLSSKKYSGQGITE